jgi:hypothetical protein
MLFLCIDFYTCVLLFTIFPYNELDQPLHWHGKLKSCVVSQLFSRFLT